MARIAAPVIRVPRRRASARTVSASSHSKDPAGTEGAEKVMPASACRRSATGPAKVTVTGMATPTTSPAAGDTATAWIALLTAATPGVVDAASDNAATPTMISTYRMALRMSSEPPLPSGHPDRRDPITF